MRALPILLLMASKLGAEQRASRLARQIVESWRQLQWSNITIVAQTGHENVRAHILKQARFTNIQFVGDSEAPGIPQQLGDDQLPYLTFTTSPDDNCEEIFDTIRLSRGNSVLIVMHHNNNFQSRWDHIKVPLGFFVLTTSDFKLYKILTGRDGNHLVKEVHRKNHNSNSSIRPQEDISGAKLILQSMTYAPYSSYVSCENITRRCRVSGIVHDALEIMAKRANFTFETFLHPSMTWLSKMPESAEEVNGSSNIFESVIAGDNDLPLGVWAVIAERKKWADFTFNMFNQDFNCFVNKDFVGTQLNSHLLLDPFTWISWLIMITLLLKMDLITTFLKGKFSHAKDTVYFISLFSGILEFLILAYFGGALTMFLVTQPEVPFRTQLEGLRNSDWSLLVIAGDESYFGHTFDLERYPKIKAKNEEIYSKSFPPATQRRLGHILKDLSSRPNHFTITIDRRLVWARNHPNNKAISNFNLLKFCDTVRHRAALMIPKNSPYKDALNYWILKLRDFGLMRQLEQQLGAADQPLKSSDWSPITIGQMGILLKADLAVLLTAFAVFIFEQISHKFLKEIV
jgi:hypothetical protein